MIESKLNFKVQYGDTDAYKVAWHGSYLRWMEAGRVDLLALNGIDIKKLDEEQGTVMPVVEINIKYKRSATLLEDVIVNTKITEIKNPYVVFEQIITNKEGEVFTEATVKGVAVCKGKLVRDVKSIIIKE